MRRLFLPKGIAALGILRKRSIFLGQKAVNMDIYPVIRPFHAMAKPSGPDCNAQCAYCFYVEKKGLFANTHHLRMADDVLEHYILNYICSTAEGETVAFTWQGGEPTLSGRTFFQRALALQKKYAANRTITNSFQTNGILLNDKWCHFFAEHAILVGLSLDGPESVHDHYRKCSTGASSHSYVMRAMAMLQKHNVAYNILATVNAHSARYPLQVYNFLRDAGAEYIQFLPIVERLPEAEDIKSGLVLHGPHLSSCAATSWSVPPLAYGRFLTDIFDVWLKRDVGSLFVLNFEWALANYMGYTGAVCHHQPTCGRSVIVEHNGDVYPCDHYVYPKYKMGNVTKQSFASMIDSPEQEDFGTQKHTKLDQQCLQCPVLRACHGGCPKHRFVRNAHDGTAHNYLCKGLHHFFSYIAPYLNVMRTLITHGHPVSAMKDMSFVTKIPPYSAE